MGNTDLFSLLGYILCILFIITATILLKDQSKQIHTLCIIALRHNSNNANVLEICSNVSYTLEDYKEMK